MLFESLSEFYKRRTGVTKKRIRKVRPLPPVILMKVIGKSIVNNSNLRFLFQLVVVKILVQM
jgi:hypothetical protein